jgi:hypothetical protein
MLSIFKTPSQIAYVVFETVPLNVMYREAAQENRFRTDTGARGVTGSLSVGRSNTDIWE